MKSPFWYLLPVFLGIIGGLIAYMILKKDDSQKAKKALLIGLITSIPFFAWVGLQVQFGIPNPFYVVASGGMGPTLDMYDVIITQGHEPFEDIAIGDIIVFLRPSDHNRVQFARVVSILDDDPKTIRTQGDANNASIPGTDFPITEEEYIGKVVYTLPQIGYVILLLKPPINYVIIIMYFGIVLAILQSKHKKFKKLPYSETSTLFYYECPSCHSSSIQNNPDGSVNCPDCNFRI